MSATAQAVTLADPPRPRAGAKNLLKLLPYMARYKGGVVLGLLALVAMGLVGNLPPLLIGMITDVISGTPVPMPHLIGITRRALAPLFAYYHPLNGRALVFFCSLLVVTLAVKGVLSFWTRWILIGISRDIEYDLRNDLLARLLQLEPEFYLRNRTGELMSRATNDLNAVRMVLGPGVMYSATSAVTMLLAILLMIEISPRLTLWVMLPVPVVAVVVRHFGKVINDLYEKIQAMLAVLSAKAQENLAGVRVVRAYAQEDAEVRGFDAPNREYVARNMKLIRTWSMFMPSLQALIGTTFLIVLWEGGRMVIQGEMSLGALIAFYVFMLQLIWPMVALGWVTNIFQRGAASMGRMNFILEAKPKIDDREAKLDGQPPIRGEVEIRNLTFSYPTLQGEAGAPDGAANRADGEPVLRDISLRVPAGSTLAVVGPTGCGKSTLAALIARLFESPDGTLLIDGRPIRQWPLATLRRAIGFVPQDTYLFSATLNENIAFGVQAAAPEQVERAARVASIWNEIQEFPKKLETLVGERGITLSGGQKQRTALARAILREPQILILDDALSSVDTDTEDRILAGLAEVIRQRTTILISHRCSTVRNADLIVVLRAGSIVERGTHTELLALGGYYSDLYQKQLLEEELERA